MHGFDANNVPEQIKSIGKTAVLSKILQAGIRLVVLGEASVGKTTLISAAIGQPVYESTPAHTIKFNTNGSSITEIKGLHASNKNRSLVWKSVVEFIDKNNTNIIWFCVGTDFVDSNDEVWHWLKCLSQVCHVVLVRTKCLSPSQSLTRDVAARLTVHPPPVVCLLAQDMQLNPKGGGAVVEGYGVDDLVSVTEEALRSSVRGSDDVIRGAMAKLHKQVTRDEERYTSEEAHKGVILSSLRSLSATDEAHEIPNKDKDLLQLKDDDFEIVPRPESPGSGFVHLVKSKQARTAMGAIVAFAVIRQLATMSKPY